MSQPTPNITVPVDLTNPGQFFACCGLLELADRLWPGAEGWFQDDTFYITAQGSLVEFISEFVRSDISSSLSPEELRRLASLLSQEKATLTQDDQQEKASLQAKWRMERLQMPFGLWLDWWRDGYGDRTPLKTWAAKQLIAAMAKQMFAIVRERAVSEVRDCGNLFFSTDDDSLPFNFDSDLSRTGNAREAGFSADTLKVKCSYKPMLELFAFAALQRFQPAARGERFVYCTWSNRLPASVACVAASGMIAHRHEKRFEFGLFDRTKYMKAFLPAIPLTQGV